MIGIIANPSEHAMVCEFFELFKTPWEFYRPDRRSSCCVASLDVKHAMKTVVAS
jgi:hypothetical protein